MHNDSNPPFVNRTLELDELDRLSKRPDPIVIFGRRRVGKTRLLTHWIKKNQALYTQAIQSDPRTQLEQAFYDVKPWLETSIVPKTWPEFFEILELQGRKWVFCIDEFPYLVASDPSLPSIFQKWLDHRKKKNVTLILTGSSHHMMHELFLNRSAPLFGRASKVIQIRPMDYNAFSQVMKPASVAASRHEVNFMKFALVGGVPKYWEFLEPEDSPIKAAEKLYFNLSPFMENEPERLLGDENVLTLGSLSILEAIGRGSHKPSEVANRIGVPQTHLSRPLQKLIDASLIRREVPFGESPRNAKRTLYRICDPALRFWYSVYSPHRVLWRTYDDAKKLQLLRQHTSTVFEDFCRDIHGGASRYWEKDAGFDLVREVPGGSAQHELIVTEVKFKTVLPGEKKRLCREMEAKWGHTRLSLRFNRPSFEVMDTGVLG